VPELLADAAPAFWARAAARADLASEPVFRLLCPGPLDRPRGDEERVLLGLGDGSFARQVARLRQLSGPLLGRVLVLLGTGQPFEPEFLRALVGAPGPQALLADSVFRHLVGRLPDGERREVAAAWDNARGWLWNGRPVGRGSEQQLLLDLLAEANRLCGKSTAPAWQAMLTAGPGEPRPPTAWLTLPDAPAAGDEPGAH
jgi:hypothetical protein